MRQFEEQIRDYIFENKQLVSDLTIVRALDLPDGYIAAGYIRNCVWDRLHGFHVQYNHSDIDVVYFDDQDSSEERDRALEHYLRELTGNEKWTVKNQARMHAKNGDQPYANTANAMAHWPETATALGASLDENDNLVLVAPYGVEDLLELKIRQSPRFKDRAYFLSRVKRKRWLETWPHLTLIGN